MTERINFVYRAFDEFGNLLYIGCTKNPEGRWKQHIAVRASWAQYAQRFALSGPYDRATALALEAAAIQAERPYFNSTLEEGGDASRRTAARARLVKELHMRRPDLLGQAFDSPEHAEFGRELKNIGATLDRTHPVVTDSERHARYLNDLYDRGAWAPDETEVAA